MTAKPTHEELAKKVQDPQKKFTLGKRLKMEEKLQQLEHMVMSIKNPIALVDQNYNYVYVNAAYCEAFQKAPHDIIAHPVANIFGRELFDSVLKSQYDQCFEGKNVHFQTWYDFPGWGRRYMDVNYYPYFEKEGSVLAVAVNAHDITEIKQLEIKLKESEERFRAFMDNNPAAVYIKDKNDRHIYGNPAAFKSAKLKPDEFIGSTTRDLWPPQIAEKLIKLDRKVIDGDIPRITEEWEMTEKSGKKWRRDIKFPIKLGSGKKLLGGIAIDITEIKRSEQKLQMMQFSIDHALDRIAWISPDGHFLYANKSACEEMGYTLEEVLSMSVPDIDPNFPVERWAEHYQELKNRGSLRLETQQTDRDGKTHDIEVSTNYLKFGDREFMCSFGRDITERKRAERKIEELSRFEQLLSDISTSFIDLPMEKIDRSINDALEQVGRFLTADRCSLGNVTADHKEMLVTHVWHSRPVPGVKQSYAIARYPWLLSTFITGKELLWNRSEGLPNGSEADIRLLEESGMQSFAGIPVTIAGKITACLGISSISEQKQWDTEITHRLKHLSRIFGSVLARKHTEEALLRSQEDFRILAGKLLSAQESERRRLAREMHDDLSQRIAVLAIDIAKIERHYKDMKDPGVENLQSVRERLVKLSGDIHAISRQLHPSILDDLGLVDAVKSECSSFAHREGIAVDYQAETIPPMITKDVAICFYRIVQEGLRNVAKHAKTKKVAVSLSGKNDSLYLTIKDQGKGFDPKEAESKFGLGLSSMRERIRLIRGDISIESQPGHGTVINVQAPLLNR
ncbi:MAG: PAS domain S-box protein [Desulfobacterales bacterium]|jgi:PAS domain S-box-containing protein